MNEFTFGSLFAGIAGFEIAFERCGMKCEWQVEIDKHCQDVLVKQYPDVVRFSDVRKVGKRELKPVDLVCGGFPCQDISVAGRREGLAGERSGLWYEFHRIITELNPRWVVIENVPGLLNSNGGKDFAILLGGLTGVVPEVPDRGWGNAGLARGGYYNVAYRVLDAQFFGVPQRRRRVFIVGHLGDGRAAQVLFERQGCAGDNPQGGKAGQDIAYPLTHSTTTDHRDESQQTYITEKGSYWDGSQLSDTLDRSMLGKGQMMPEKRRFPVVLERDPSSFDVRNLAEGEISPTLQSKNQGGWSLNYTPVVIEPEEQKDDNLTAYGLVTKGTGEAWLTEEKHTSLTEGGGQAGQGYPAVVFQQNQRDEVRLMDKAGALPANPGMKQQNYVYQWASGGGDDLKDSAQSLRSNPESNYQLVVEEEELDELRDGEVVDGRVIYWHKCPYCGFEMCVDHEECPSCLKDSEGNLSTRWDHERCRIIDENEVCKTLLANEGRGHGVPTIAFRPNNSAKARGLGIGEDVAPTIPSAEGGNKVVVAVEQGAVGHSGGATLKMNELANTVNTQTGSETTAMFNGVWQMHHASEAYREGADDETVPTLQERMGTGGNNVTMIGVRRLTPTECARLQGFPDDWLDGSDSVKYRQLGNAVAVPVVEWIGGRIMKQEREE